MRRRSVFVWVCVGLATACKATEDPPPPPPPAGTDSATSVGSGGTGDTGFDPMCEPTDDPDPGTGSGSGGGSGGFKFDVGGDDGGFDFPVSCDEVQDRRSNLGCEFWAVDLPNDWRGTDFSPPAGDQQFAVVVANASALEPATVSVYRGSETVAVDTQIIPVDSVHTFELDPLNIDPTQNTTDGLAYRIESDFPVTAYQFNPLDNTLPVYSNDASVLLPSHVMGMDYGVATSDAIWLAMFPGDPDPVKAGAFLSVVGISDDTVVDVLPSTPLYEGQVEGVSVGRGQVFTVLSDAAANQYGNLSGSRVHADKPVAVFAGNVATVEPTQAQKCCADHMEQQLLPIEAWGTSYAVAPPASANGQVNDPAVYRIVGAYDGTEVVYCPSAPPGAPNLLDAFQSRKFETDRPFVIKSTDPDKPFAVFQFLESKDALPGNNVNGDPAMLQLPPADQFQYKYVFAVPEGYGGGNWVTVVTRGKAGMTLDGVPVDTDDYRTVGVLGGKTHHYVHLQVGAGSHLLEANAPVGITVVGYDEAVSYGYPGGAGVNVIAIPPAAG